MKRMIGATSVALLLATSPALAVEPELGARLGTSADAIGKALSQSGYEMTKYESERREIEVNARKGERYLEVKIDPRSGEVYAIEEKFRRRNDDERRHEDDRRRYDDDSRRGDES